MREETKTLTAEATKELSLQDKLRVLIELIDEGYIDPCSKSELDELGKRIREIPNAFNIALDAFRLEAMVTAHVVEAVTSDTGVFYKGRK
jgi:hypothetical protein